MKKTLSIAQANILYLITMILVVTAGSAVQVVNLSWGLVATEIVLILLPTVIMLRVNGISLREGLRLRPIGLGLAAICLLIGISTWFYVAFIDALMMQISGQPPVSITSDMLPEGVVESAAYFLALAILAPICEEALFRGAIQGAYERQRSARFAIITASLLFAFYHFRLTGLLALLPIALTLGYVGWRTQSLYAVILIHLGNNAVSAIYGLISMNNPDFQVSLTNPITAGVGFAAAMGLLFLLRRLVPAPVREPEDETAEAAADVPAPKPGWFKLYWPLVASGLLFMVVSGFTLAAMLNPELMATRGISFDAPDWEKPWTYQYAITNQAGETVGDALCTIYPGPETSLLDCSSSTEGYEIQTGSSFYKDSTHSLRWRATWDAQSLELVAFDLTRFDENGTQEFGARLEGTQLTVSSADGMAATEEMGDSVLLGHEWAWRMMFVNTDTGNVKLVPFGYLMTWDEEAQRSRPQVKEELLQIAPFDTITVPAGKFEAWKVTIDNQKTAWYSSDGENKLLRYDDGMSIYSLVE